VLRRVWHVATWVVILGAVAALVVAVLVPRLAGATPYVVLSSSMEPDLPPGTLVVVRPTPIDRIGVGDVVTYQLRSGEPVVATHRVVAASTDLTGETTLVTQGDANDVADEHPVRDVQLRGRLWYAVPWLGHATTVLTGRQREIAVQVVGGGLLAYAAFMFTSALRDRLRRKEGPTA